MIYYEKQNQWKRGTVVKGHRYQDGYVSFYLDNDPVPKYDYLEPIDDSQEEIDFVKEVGKIAHSRGVGNCVPIILRSDEYIHFANHIDKWNPWKAVATAKLYNAELIEINKAPKLE